MQPAVDQVDARHSRVEDRAPHVIEPLLRQGPELLGVIETDALDDAVDIFGKSRQHEADDCGPTPPTRPGPPSSTATDQPR